MKNLSKAKFNGKLSIHKCNLALKSNHRPENFFLFSIYGVPKVTRDVFASKLLLFTGFLVTGESL